MQTERISDPDHLPLIHDVVGATNVEPGKVLDPVVAVETAPSLTHLRDPRPHIYRRPADGDRPRGGQVGVYEQLVARQGRRDLLRRCVPVQMPPTTYRRAQASDGHEPQRLAMPHRSHHINHSTSPRLSTRRTSEAPRSRTRERSLFVSRPSFVARRSRLRVTGVRSLL